jgi:serine/threonine protein kinase
MVNKKSGEKSNSHKARTESALKQHLLAPREVKLDHRVGAGAFGEVYRGRCFGQLVAVKTMLHVTEDNVRLFRGEILLTSVLRHPCIVNFVGACWSRELTCLVLEWVPKGSLGDFLADSMAAAGVGGALRWDEQLLTLAQDVARGMAYLHGREYLDEADGSKRQCILHRFVRPRAAFPQGAALHLLLPASSCGAL